MKNNISLSIEILVKNEKLYRPNDLILFSQEKFKLYGLVGKFIFLPKKNIVSLALWQVEPPRLNHVFPIYESSFCHFKMLRIISLQYVYFRLKKKSANDSFWTITPPYIIFLWI